MKTLPVKLVTNGNMAGDITSAVQQVQTALGYAIQAIYTTSGTLGGTLKLQACVNRQQYPTGEVLVAGTFVDVPGSSQTISAAGSYIWDVEPSQVPYVRLVYTHAGGDSGTLNVYFFSKGF